MATAKFPTNKVIKWCDDTIKRLEEEREERIQERIEYYMKPTVFWGITLHKGLSYDDAEVFVHSDNHSKTMLESFEDYSATDYGSERQYHAYKLKQMCKHINENAFSDNVIELTDKDINKLYIYVD